MDVRVSPERASRQMCVKTVLRVLLFLLVKAVTSKVSDEDFKETELDETGQAPSCTFLSLHLWARLTWQQSAAGRVLELGGGLKPPSLAMVRSLCTGCSCTAEQAYQTVFSFHLRSAADDRFPPQPEPCVHLLKRSGRECFSKFPSVAEALGPRP